MAKASGERESGSLGLGFGFGVLDRRLAWFGLV